MLGRISSPCPHPRNPLNPPNPRCCSICHCGLAVSPVKQEEDRGMPATMTKGGDAD
jgi:hypothetical protein